MRIWEANLTIVCKKNFSPVLSFFEHGEINGAEGRFSHVRLSSGRLCAEAFS
jgi:hypothetical protein